MSSAAEKALVKAAPQGMGLLELAQYAAASGYFDARDVAKAVTKMAYGAELGIPPITALMGVDIINGAPAPSAGLLASCIRRHPRYDFRVQVLNAERCTLDFFEDGQKVGESTFTLDDAKAADLLSGPNKGNWSRYPRNMLFARAVSNGARWFTPDVFGGSVYTPEELGQAVTPDGTIIDVEPIEEKPYEPPRERSDIEDRPRLVTDRGKLLERYGELLSKARHLGLVEDASQWTLPEGTTTEELTRRGLALRELIERAEAEPVVDEWDRNRKLTAQAYRLKLRAPTLPNDTPLDQVKQANDELGAQIEERFMVLGLAGKA